MADVTDISKLVTASDVRVIDFSVFISIWCAINIDLVCSKESNNQSSLLDTLRQCRKRQDVYQTLGPGSRAELATVLEFGSLFTAPYKGSELYIDIHESPRDQAMQSLTEKISFLPFVLEIMSAWKEFASKTIKSPFLCA
ncbi:hypothetical protein ACSBR1_015887 [Camellia fascicularis]